MNNSPLSRYQQKKILRAFAHELTAVQASNMLEFNRNTINRYYRFFRLTIYYHQRLEMERLVGEIEMDESYFGGHRKGLKGRSTKQKVPVFGLLKRGGRVLRGSGSRRQGGDAAADSTRTGDGRKYLIYRLIQKLRRPGLGRI